MQTFEQYDADTKLLQRGIMAHEDQAHQLGLHAFPNLPALMNEKTTSIAPLQLHPADRDRTCIIGCENGRIYVVSPRVDEGTIDFKRLPSQHSCAVNRIALHPSLCEFVSIDVEGNAFVWNAVGLSAPPLKCSVFAHCATCFDPFGQTGFAHLWLQYD